MSKEVLCPRCGLPVAIDPPPDALSAVGSIEAHHTVEVTLPVTTVDVGVRFDSEPVVHDATARPEGGLGVFVAGDTDRRTPAPIADQEDGSSDGIFSGEIDPLLGEFVPPSNDSEAAVEADDFPGVVADDPRPSSPDLGVWALDPGPPTSARPVGTDDQPTEDEGEDPPGLSLGTVLLASYASAVTLALACVLWTHRDRGPTGPETMPADSRPDLGADGAGARKAAPPIAADHLASIGRSLRVGALEVTPIEILDRPVRLVREGSEGNKSERSEPGDVLQLRLRIRNVSGEPIAPIDAKLARAPDLGPPETYIETGRGDRIDPFPLAPNSEWAISGQPFGPIAPGATAETLIASQAEASGRLADPLVWRIRLRTSPDRVETIGVRFKSADVR